MNRPAPRSRPVVEPLEDRLTPTATRLVIDFTPDTQSTDQFPGSDRGSFAQVFQAAARSARPARFLDFNHDGRVDAGTDVVLAAGVVKNLVSRYFAPWASLNVKVVYGDVLRQTQFGARELAAGLNSSSLQTFVMYVGGGRSDAAVLGESYQAAVGFNNEDFGRVYTTNVVRYLATVNPAATPMDFARLVASTTAHEMGHMLGLGHPHPDYTDKSNVMDSSADGHGDSFLNRTYSADLYLTRSASKTTASPQNPYQELARSFLGQPDEYSYVSSYKALAAHRRQAVDAVFADLAVSG